MSSNGEAQHYVLERSAATRSSINAGNQSENNDRGPRDLFIGRRERIARHSNADAWSEISPTLTEEASTRTGEFLRRCSSDFCSDCAIGLGSQLWRSPFN